MFVVHFSGHPLCPVQSFKDYLARLHPSNDWLWQRPVDSFEDASTYWYTNQVLGKNTLAGMMKAICKRAGLQKEFSNHSIRATSITVLDINKFTNRDIMSVSGHRSESSLKTYTSRVSVGRKHEMSKALTDALLSTENNTVTDIEVDKNNSDDGIVVCDGIINLTEAELQDLMSPMDVENTENIILNTSTEVIPQTSTGCTVSVKPELSDITNVLKCVNNNNTMGFMPYITGCVVNFNVNCAK